MGCAVLVVDDEWLIASDVQWALEDAGYDVVGPAATVAQALTLVRSHELGAAVLDVNLAGETSYPIAEALIAQGTPFVFVSGFARGDLAPAFQDHPLLPKPLALEKLPPALASLGVPLAS